MKDIFILGFSFILLVSIANVVVAESAHAAVGWWVAAIQSLLLLIDEIKVERWDSKNEDD